MADNYLDLHNLEATETPFTVQKVVDSDLQNSPECQLPDDVPLTITLPSLDVPLPDLDCDFNVDIPLVPLPWFCTPHLLGSINVTSTDEGDSTISFNQINECDYELSGDLCIPSVELNITVQTGEANNSTYVTVETDPTPLTLTRVSPCDYRLDGTITITDTWSCGDLHVEWSGVSDDVIVSIVYDSPAESKLSLGLEAHWTDCELDLSASPSLDINIDCDNFDLDVATGGDNYEVDVTYGAGGGTGSLGMSITDSGPGCAKTIELDPSLTVDIDCSEFAFSVVGSLTAINVTANGHNIGTLSVPTFSASNDNCKPKLTIAGAPSTLDLTFSTATLTVCDGESTRDITVVIIPD